MWHHWINYIYIYLLTLNGLYGIYTAGASKIIGLECAGVIVDTNSTTLYKQGDRVMCLLGGGGYAQYVAVPVTHCIPIPSHMSFTDAGAIPEVYLTAYQLIRYIAHCSPNEYILIHAGASGVGTAAIQLAKLFGCKSIATAGTSDKLKFCMELGASTAINYKDQSFGTEVQNYLRDNKVSNGISIVIDPVGKSHFNDNIDVLGLDGRYILFGLMSGADVQLNLGKVLAKRIRIEGTTLRSRSAEYKTDLVKSFIRDVLPALDNKTCKPIIYKEMSMDQIVDAHKLMESNETTGKIVIHVPQQ